MSRLHRLYRNRLVDKTADTTVDRRGFNNLRRLLATEDDAQAQIDRLKYMMHKKDQESSRGVSELMQQYVPQGKPIHDWKAEENTDLAMIHDQMAENEGDVSTDFNPELYDDNWRGRNHGDENPNKDAPGSPRVAVETDDRNRPTMAIRYWQGDNIGFSDGFYFGALYPSGSGGDTQPYIYIAHVNNPIAEVLGSYRYSPTNIYDIKSRGREVTRMTSDEIQLVDLVGTLISQGILVNGQNDIPKELEWFVAPGIRPKFAAVNVVDGPETLDAVHTLSDQDKYPQDQQERDNEQGMGGLKIEGGPEDELERAKRLMSAPRPGIEDLMQQYVPQGKPIQNWKENEEVDLAMIHDQMGENEGGAEFGGPIEGPLKQRDLPGKTDFEYHHNIHDMLIPRGNVRAAVSSDGGASIQYNMHGAIFIDTNTFSVYIHNGEMEIKKYPYALRIDRTREGTTNMTEDEEALLSKVRRIESTQAEEYMDYVIGDVKYTNDSIPNFDLEKESVALPDSGAIDEDSYGQDYSRADQSISRAPYTKMIYGK